MARTEFNTDVVYCSIKDVKRLFRKPGSFGQTDNPSEEELLEFIRDASSEIDEYTRQAWRENKVYEEYHTFDTAYRWDTGRQVMLNKTHVVTPFDSAEGDKIELWDGGEWEDWVADSSRSEGRGEDYWMDKATGQLFLFKRFSWRSPPEIRVSYRYGKPTSTTSKTTTSGDDHEVIDQPRDIKKACARIAALDLMESDHFTNLIPGGDGGMSPQETVRSWKNEVWGDEQRKGLLERHKLDPVWVEPY